MVILELKTALGSEVTTSNFTQSWTATIFPPVKLHSALGNIVKPF